MIAALVGRAVLNRRIFADVIVYIFPHQHTTELIEAVGVNTN